MSNNTHRPPRGPLGGGPHARMTPGARPQDFKGTMAKTIRFLRSSLPAILIAFLLAIGGVVLTLNIPKVLGNATDEIMVGLMKQNVYDAIEEVLDSNAGAITPDIAWQALQAASQEPNPKDVTSNTQWSILYDNTNCTASIALRRDWGNKTEIDLGDMTGF